MLKITRFKILILALIAATCMTAVVGCNCGVKVTYTLAYTASEGGQIGGMAEQRVEEGKDGETVTAIANEGYRFVGWSDGVTTANRQEQAVKADQAYIAYFEVSPVYYTLTYSAGNGGQISGTAKQEVEEGKDGEAVTAIANEGYRFVKWSDGFLMSERQDRNVTKDISITAEFVLLEYYTLTYSVGDGGTIEGIPKQTVLEVTSGKAVTAIPNEGYKFVKWSDGVTTAKRQDRIVMADKSVTAEFAPLEYYTLTYSAADGGTIEGIPKQTVLELTDGETVTAIAARGYVFSRWSDGVRTASRQDKGVSESKTLIAYFDSIPTYTLTYSVSIEERGYIEGEAVQTVFEGESGTTVTAIPKSDDYVFKYWSDGLRTQSRTDKNITSDINVYAIFWNDVFTYEYTVSSEEGGYIEGEALQRIHYDDVGSEVTAVPNEGYVFTGWSDGVKTSTRTDDRQNNLKLIAYFRKGLEINYRVNKGVGGHIEGDAKQYVIKGGDSIAVKAVADEGYVFTGWSDGVTDAERYDTGLKEDFSMSAYFEPIKKVFSYNYCGATSNADIQTVSVMRADPKASTFIVPQRSGYSFVGWYADENYMTRVTDEDGNLMYGFNTVTLETDTLYARWADPDDDTCVFRILLVVVDEIDATLKLRADYTQTKRLHYRITMPERLLCKQIAGRMSAYLNDWFAGKVKFEIDTYFTTQVVDTEDFRDSNHYLTVDRMKEVKYLYERYDSLLTFLDMNDDDGEFREPPLAGMAGYKRGCVYLDRHIKSMMFHAEKLLQRDESVEYLWAMLYIETALHEFVHTVEHRYSYGDIYEFHDAIWDLPYNEFETMRMYLLCEIEKDGANLGIPSTFWTKELWKVDEILKKED